MKEEKKTLDETQTGDFRPVRNIRMCGIVYGSKFRRYDSRKRQIVSAFVSPSGFMLLVNVHFLDNYIAVIKLDTPLYKAISDLKFETNLRFLNSCYNRHNDFLVVYGKHLSEQKLLFVDVKDKLSLNRSVSISQTCRSLTCHNDKLYLLDEDSVYIYSFDGEFIETLYKEENVSSAFLAIAVSNDGSMIYILSKIRYLITINSSGNHLFTLNSPEFEYYSLSNEQRVCVDDQGNVFILDKKIRSGSHLIKIIQVSPNGEKCYGVLFQFDSYIDCKNIVFDSDRCALVLVGSTKMITVLTLR
jgi:hypothetical protein